MLFGEVKKRDALKAKEGGEVKNFGIDFFFFNLFRDTSAAYGGSQARG